MAANADRHLLFGLLALQVGLIDQAQLVAAFHAWTRDKARPLADHLQALGHLDAEQRGLVEALAAQHLKKHDGDAEKSLAAVGVESDRSDGASPPSPTPRSTRHSSASSSAPATATPTAPPPTPSAPPPATASGSASSAPTPRAAWAPSSWPWTRSCTARWR